MTTIRGIEAALPVDLSGPTLSIWPWNMMRRNAIHMVVGAGDVA
jgi:hypothetical protein